MSCLQPAHSLFHTTCKIHPPLKSPDRSTSLSLPRSSRVEVSLRHSLLDKVKGRASRGLQAEKEELTSGMIAPLEDTQREEAGKGSR